MTGRTAGYCAGYGMPGYANPVAGGGLGAGFGRGRVARGRGLGAGGYGRRNRFYATGLPGFMRFGGYAAPYRYPTPFQKPDPEIEKQALKNQAKALQSELDLINQRLAEVESGSASG